jgi:diguanylate cyclase (GGDEF)-like protein
MSAYVDERGDNGLGAALTAHPDARVTGILENGEFCAPPPGLAPGHEVLRGRSILELVPPSDWPGIIAGWERLKQYGSHAGTSGSIGDSASSILSFDVRARYGMFVMLVLPTVDAVVQSVPDDELPVASRFGTYLRDVLATIVDVDEGARSLLGWDVAAVAEHAGRDLIHPDDAANAEANWLAALVAPGVPRRWRGRHLHADGTYRWIEFTNTNRLEDLGHVVSEMMDISDEMATADALRQRDELLARLNDALPLGVAHVDAQRRVIYANHQLPAIVGRDIDEDFDRQFGAVVAEDRALLDVALTRTLADGTDADLEVHLRVDTSDATCGSADPDRICSVSVRALRNAEQVSGAVLCVSDITEATTMRRELEHQARFDRLTGCLNPAASVAAVGRALAGAGEGGAGTAVLFVDLDRFKPVNDELGHAIGDLVLAAVADRLRELVRSDDRVGRIGGDEFLVVCPGTTWEVAGTIAERITAALDAPIVVGESTVRIGASVGVAWSRDAAATAESLVDQADAAMYARKRARREASGAAGRE